MRCTPGNLTDTIVMIFRFLVFIWFLWERMFSASTQANVRR
jgi:hypothetical protein